MTNQYLHYPILDIIFSLYLLVYFPLESIWRSLIKKSSTPTVPALRSYWRQARYVLMLLAVLLLVCWLGGHSAQQLGLGFPPPPAGLWGLAGAVCLLASLHAFGLRAELKMTSDERLKQEDKLRKMPFSMPQTRVEICAYFATMIGMTAMWEVLFRGYLLLVLTPYTGLPIAVALAAIAYGAGHGYHNIKQFLGSIAAALFFTIGYALTGSLWWLMVLHAAAPVAMYFVARKLI